MDSGSLKYIPTPPHEELLPPPRRRFPFGMSTVNIFLTCLVFVLFVILIYSRFIAAPREMQGDVLLSVESGKGLNSLALELAEKDIIRSPFAFKSFMVIFGGPKGLRAGDYYFEKPQNVMIVAWRLSKSAYDLNNVKITIPEGYNRMEIADSIVKSKKFTHFDKTEFVRLAEKYEGYLFPDTYLFLPNVTEKQVIDAMTENYRERIKTIEKEVKSFGRPIEDVIKMASIVEEEARTEETRRIVAGILWKRLSEGMPLQVDAAFVFVNGEKDSRYISNGDLKIDSPYNTYVYKGLPPGAISNPGLDAIRATITPLPTKYYFYLSDEEGNMHYASTLAEHERNKERYLGY